jgi:hypothetical protein
MIILRVRPRDAPRKATHLPPCNMDARNVLPAGSSRKRRAPERYTDSSEFQSQYCKLMLDDIDDDEVQAALQDEDFTSEDDTDSGDEGAAASSWIVHQPEDGADDDFVPITSSDSDDMETDDPVCCPDGQVPLYRGRAWLVDECAAAYALAFHGGEPVQPDGALRTAEGAMYPDGAAAQLDGDGVIAADGFVAHLNAMTEGATWAADDDA